MLPAVLSIMACLDAVAMIDKNARKPLLLIGSAEMFDGLILAPIDP